MEFEELENLVRTHINQGKVDEIQEYPVKNLILSWINQVKKFHKDKNGN